MSFSLVRQFSDGFGRLINRADSRSGVVKHITTTAAAAAAETTKNNNNTKSKAGNLRNPNFRNPSSSHGHSASPSPGSQSVVSHVSYSSDNQNAMDQVVDPDALVSSERADADDHKTVRVDAAPAVAGAKAAAALPPPNHTAGSSGSHSSSPHKNHIVADAPLKKPAAKKGEKSVKISVDAKPDGRSVKRNSNSANPKIQSDSTLEPGVGHKPSDNLTFEDTVRKVRKQKRLDTGTETNTAPSQPAHFSHLSPPPSLSLSLYLSLSLSIPHHSSKIRNRRPLSGAGITCTKSSRYLGSVALWTCTASP